MHECNDDCHQAERAVMQAEEEVRLFKTIVSVMLILDGHEDYIAMLLNAISGIYSDAA